MRIKYGDDPTRFMDSEVDLNFAIQVLYFSFAPRTVTVVLFAGIFQLNGIKLSFATY